MDHIINKGLLALILLICASGILFSCGTLILMLFLGTDPGMDTVLALDHLDSFSVSGLPAAAAPDASPYSNNLSLETPPLASTDTVSVEVYTSERKVAEYDCLSGLDSWEGLTHLGCEAGIPYDYSPDEEYSVFAVLRRGGLEYASGPLRMSTDWRAYEASFWSLGGSLSILLLLVFLFIVLPSGGAAVYFTLTTRHKEAYAGEYTLSSLMAPFSKAKTLGDKLNAILVSPYFWAFELLGILFILVYMALSVQVWKSWTALLSFLLSGVISFFVPFMLSLFVWQSEYREREPLRAIVTMFLWGMLAALMAIGLNSIAGVVLSALGLAFLSAFLLAPPLEEFFKGSGLALLSEHHEFGSVEDGIVFGFVIGMGFSFIENWIYLLDSPFGADPGSWLFLFTLRALVFSTNHGLYTAITGAVVGYLMEKRFQVPALGLLIGFPVAAFFHAMHNSGETMAALLGGAGTFLYCCFLIPIFDYGGLILLAGLFIRAVLRRR